MKIYAVVDNNVGSSTGLTTILSYHLTIEGARSAISEDIRGMKREPYSNDVVEDYTYEFIRGIEVME